MDVCVKRTDGSIWCNNGYFNINNSLANKIEESNLPYKSSYLLYTCNENVSKISKVIFSLRKEPAKYMEKDIIVKDEVISDTCISYNRSTKELKKSDSWDTFFDNDKKEDYLSQNKNAVELIKFCLDVYSQNEYVYDLLTSLVPTLRGGFINNVGENMYAFCVYAVNLYNNIDNIGSFEKTAKAMGKKFIYKNIEKKDFSLNNAKKLNNVMDIPIEAANLMKKLKLENYYNDFKRLAQINTNYVVTFLNAVNDLKRVINVSKMVGTKNLNNQVGNILGSLIKLMESGYYDNFKVLLNYLFREFFYFNESNIGLPCDEARNLIDYVNLATNMGGKSSLKFDKMPRNLKRAHAILSTNNMILSNPRPQEFIDAVSCYSDFVSWVPSDKTTPYIFKAPENELELLNEGNILHHCVASYRDLIVDNGCIVVFMRKRDDPNTPFVTIEYLKGKTVQVKEKYNEDVEDKNVLEVIGKWLAVTRKKEIAKLSGK